MDPIYYEGFSTVLSENAGLLPKDDSFYSLPEEVQEQVNAHAKEFRTSHDMQSYIDDLMRRA